MDVKEKKRIKEEEVRLNEYAIKLIKRLCDAMGRSGRISCHR